MIKRAFDVVMSTVFLMLFLPLMLIISIAISCSMGMPVIFRQQRPGQHGRLFTMYKFRSMMNKFDANGEPLPEAERLTPVGRFINSTRLDELPEFFNVLKGDMSIVGPRPLLPIYLEHYTPEQARRHNVKPGITGLAQVSRKRHMTISEKLKLDTYYVDNQSLWLDLKIMIATIPKVIGCSGDDPYPSDVATQIDDIGITMEGRLKLQGQKGGSSPDNQA